MLGMYCHIFQWHRASEDEHVNVNGISICDFAVEKLALNLTKQKQTSIHKNIQQHITNTKN